LKTEIIQVHPEFPEMEKIAYCAKVIRRGGLVVFPTDTVYGIAADFNNPKAMERLRDVKQRSQDKKFSVLISQKTLISNYTSTTDPIVYKIIDKYWPGPLTIIVPAKDKTDTIGIRMPDHVIALNLVKEAQCSIAGPSANLAGNHPPKTCKEALKDLDGLVDVAIDGGEAYHGRSSTVVDLTRGQPNVLREGEISAAEINRVSSRKTILFICTGNSCRSVMAEYLLRKLSVSRTDLQILSAGTGVFLRSQASAETIATLRKEGIDATKHLSQPVDSILLKKSDLILVMTKIHRQQVLDRVPSVENRTYLLKEFSSNSSLAQDQLDIPDPIGRPAEVYEECMLDIKDALNKVINLI
jgi:L-threonylcarbamoyladenylate synthase